MSKVIRYHFLPQTWLMLPNKALHLSLSLSAGFIHTTIPKIIFGGACNCGFEQGVGPQVRRAVNFILLIKHTRI